MIKDVWVKISYFWFIIMLAIVGFLCGAFDVNADTLTQWTTKEARFMYDNRGTDTWSSWRTLNGNNVLTINGEDVNFPIKSIAWHFKYNGGLSRENSYTFEFGYKPSPDTLGLINMTWSNDDNFTCDVKLNDYGYYWYTCTLAPNSSYSSNDYFYVRLNFHQAYLTELRLFAYGFDERKGTNAVISENTNNIINNNNQNTQEIINNQTQLNSVCKNLSLSDAPLDGYIDWVGEFHEQHGSNKSTNFINIQNVNSITLLKKANTNKFACFYDIDKTMLKCFDTSSLSAGYKFNIPKGSVFFRSNFEISDNLPVYSICTNGNSSINDTLTNDNVDNPNSSIEDMQNMLPTNGTITQLIALPITLYQKVLNNINGTCNSMNLGALYGTDLIMPCIEISNYLGNTLWNTIDLIISGIFVLTIGRKMIKAFNNFTFMKEGDVIND